MGEMPDPSELERLGLFHPRGLAPEEQLRLLEFVFSLGATVEEVQRAARVSGLSGLALDLSTRPAGETYDLEDYIALAAADGVLVRRLWLAFGLPDVGELPVRVTPDAVSALDTFIGLSALVGEEAAFAIARVVGSTSTQLVESLSGAFRTQIESPQLSSGTRYSDMVAQLSAAGRDLLPLFLEAVDAVFRRHLVLVSFQLWDTDDEHSAVTLERTVGFADIVASTESVRAATVAELAAMVRAFQELVWDVVAPAGGRVVKLIGDEVMFVHDSPDRAAQIALDLVARSSQRVRVGLARGTVVGLFGDFYGETVNLAARLVAVAASAEVVVSAALAAAVRDRFVVTALAPQQLKGFGDPVVVYRLDGRSGP